MLPKQLADHLKAALAAGRVTLFLGAGFSAECKNADGENLPIGDDLAKLLWAWLGYPEPYDYSPLAEVYEAALGSAKGHAELERLIRRRLSAASIPDWYDHIAQFYWHRIYSTNADDVVEKVFDRVSDARDIPQLVNKIDPLDDYADRDPSWRQLQHVKLNGDANGSCADLTFGFHRYAERAGRDPWYEHFVRDYASTPTLFVGSQLREPLFWECLEVRGRRRRDEGEHRARSYLVARTIPPPKRAILEKLNVFPVEADARTFFEYVVSELFGGKPPDRLAVLDISEPQLAKAERALDVRAARRIERVFTCFRSVPVDRPSAPIRGKAFSWARRQHGRTSSATWTLRARSMTRSTRL